MAFWNLVRVVQGLAFLWMPGPLHTAMTHADEELLRELEAQLAVRGIRHKVTAEGRYELQTDGGPVTLSLDNLARRFGETRDTGTVTRYLDAMLSGFGMPEDWASARARVYPLMAPAGTASGSIGVELSDQSRLQVVYYDADEGAIRFLRASDAELWGITADELWAAAESNLDSVMQTTNVQFLDANGFKLGVIEAHAPFKASLIRAPGLRAKVEDELGWPVFAVAPTRDFVYLISRADADELGRVGAVVIREFNEGAYPISTEIWEVSDTGISAYGHFPTE